MVILHLWITAACTATPPTFDVTLVDELVELFPDTPVPTTTSLSLHTPRGVPVGVHLVLSNLTPDLPVDLAIAHYDGSPADATWARLIDVPVEENTGLASRTEQFDGEHNPHVIRRAPFRVFEAIEPIAPPIAAVTDPVALRVEIPIPPDARPGPHHYTIAIGHADQRREVYVRLHVHRVVVPPIGATTFQYTNWFSTANIATYHDVELWSEPFWAQLERYAALMAHGRQNTFWIRWTDIFTRADDGRLHLHEDRLVRYVRTFDKAGLHWIEGAPIANRPGGDWSRPDLNLSIVNVPATSDAGRAAIAEMTGQLRIVMDRHGWTDRWLQHLADEPTDTNAADYRELAAILREHLPGVPIVEATMSRELAGAVDIWCPQVQKYQAHRDFFETRRAEGDRLWVYTCLVPGGPWINRMLDQERLRQTLVGWSLVRYDLHGFLHWGLNHYKADPFAHSVVDHPAMPGTTNKLPAGDSHVIYPGQDGPWSSQRFEAHRLGMEDAELLRMLKRHDADATAALIASVFRSFDDYETDVTAYRVARRRLLETLDTISMLP